MRVHVGIKGSNSHDCRKLKFIFKVHSPSHHTRHIKLQQISWISARVHVCVCVRARKVYDYIIQTHRAVRRWTETKENREGQQAVLPSKTAVDIVLLISTRICCDE